MKSDHAKRFDYYEKHFKQTATGISYKGIALFELNTKQERYYKHDYDLTGEFDLYKVTKKVNKEELLFFIKCKNKILEIDVSSQDDFTIVYLAGIHKSKTIVYN